MAGHTSTNRGQRMTSRNSAARPTTSPTTICLISVKGNIMGYIFGIACFFAWLTHVFTCFAGGMWGFLVAGAIFFPIGILHGFYLWLT